MNAANLGKEIIEDFRNGKKEDTLSLEEILSTAEYTETQKKAIILSSGLMKRIHNEYDSPRKDTGEPYYTHPKAVAREIIKLKLPWYFVVIAYIHDVFETFLKLGLSEKNALKYLNKIDKNIFKEKFKDLPRSDLEKILLDIRQINNTVLGVLTLDKNKPYFNNIEEKIHNKNNKSLVEFVEHFSGISREEDLFKEELAKDMLYFGIIKLTDRGKNTRQTESFGNFDAIISLAKDFIVVYLHRDSELNNKSLLAKSDKQLSYSVQSKLGYNDFVVTNKITSQITFKYRNAADKYENQDKTNILKTNEEIILEALSRIDYLKNEHYKSLGVIRDQPKEIKKAHHIFDGFILRTYQILKDEFLEKIGQKPINSMKNYFDVYTEQDNKLLEQLIEDKADLERVKKDEHIEIYVRDIKYYLTASMLKKLFGNISHKSFHIKNFNKEYFENLDKVSYARLNGHAVENKNYSDNLHSN
jgi:hypothetical protein